MVASPFDFSRVPLVAPLRPVAAVTQGQLVTQLYRVLGGAPAPLVKRGYQLAGIRQVRDEAVDGRSRNLHDRELLAQIEAVDVFMDSMHAYPGRTFGQLYHRFFRANDLADGRLALDRPRARPRRREGPGAVDRGRAATGSPRWRRATTSPELLPSAPPVRLETAPGGHLGVLTGRAARGTTWVMLDRFLAEHEARPAARDAESAPPRRSAATLIAMRRALTILFLTFSIAAATASAAAAQAPAEEPRIRAGVTVSGVDVGDLTVAEAQARLEQTLGPVLAQDIVVTAARRSFVLHDVADRLRVPRRQDRASAR